MPVKMSIMIEPILGRPNVAERSYQSCSNKLPGQTDVERLLVLQVQQGQVGLQAAAVILLAVLLQICSQMNCWQLISCQNDLKMPDDNLLTNQSGDLENKYSES
jgi:hypothetical protein